jgi:putative transposase
MVKYRQIARRTQETLSAEECSEIAVAALNRNLTISINGTLKQKTIIQSLVGMSASKLSVHSIDKVLEKIPCETSVRYHLSKIDLDSLQEIQSKILTYSQNTILVPGKSFHFAIDFTNDPYYGEIVNANENYVIKSKMKDSTTKFYSYVSLYIVTKGQRLTLAVFPTKKGVPNVEYLRRFLKIITDMKVKITVLCLDRGFYSKDVFTFLQNEDVPHIVPVRKHGEELKKILTGNHSRYDRYTMRGNGTGEPVELTLAIDVQYHRGRNEKHGKVNLGYVVHGIDWNPRKVSSIYKNRFAIESSYRMRNIVKAKTSSRNVVLRYLLTIISFLLKNIWVALKWNYFARIQRGPRTIDDDLFRFDRFRIFVWEGIKKKLRPITSVEVLRSLG